MLVDAELEAYAALKPRSRVGAISKPRLYPTVDDWVLYRDPYNTVLRQTVPRFENRNCTMACFLHELWREHKRDWYKHITDLNKRDLRIMEVHHTRVEEPIVPMDAEGGAGEGQVTTERGGAVAVPTPGAHLGGPAGSGTPGIHHTGSQVLFGFSLEDARDLLSGVKDIAQVLEASVDAQKASEARLTALTVKFYVPKCDRHHWYNANDVERRLSLRHGCITHLQPDETDTPPTPDMAAFIIGTRDVDAQRAVSNALARVRHKFGLQVGPDEIRMTVNTNRGVVLDACMYLSARGWCVASAETPEIPKDTKHLYVYWMRGGKLWSVALTTKYLKETAVQQGGLGRVFPDQGSVPVKLPVEPRNPRFVPAEVNRMLGCLQHERGYVYRQCRGLPARQPAKIFRDDSGGAGGMFPGLQALQFPTGVPALMPPDVVSGGTITSAAPSTVEVPTKDSITHSSDQAKGQCSGQVAPKSPLVWKVPRQALQCGSPMAVEVSGDGHSEGKRCRAGSPKEPPHKKAKAVPVDGKGTCADGGPQPLTEDELVGPVDQAKQVGN